MPYLSQSARKNLKLYTYKAVDEYVYPSPHQSLIFTTPQVSYISIRP